jgi:hypothetical protein
MIINQAKSRFNSRLSSDSRRAGNSPAAAAGILNNLDVAAVSHNIKDLVLQGLGTW